MGARRPLSSRKLRRLLALGGPLALAAAAAFVGLSAPAAHASNPACDAGFSGIVVHVANGSEVFRAKACWRESVDNWEFQDTAIDGWSAVFNYPNNAVSAQLRAWGSDGADNGWNKLFMEYPEGRSLTVSLCSHDRDAGISHGCTGRSGIIS